MEEWIKPSLSISLWAICVVEVLNWSGKRSLRFVVWYKLLLYGTKSFDFGLQTVYNERCIFFKRTQEKLTFLLLFYVDDILYIGEAGLLDRFENTLSKKFHIKFRNWTETFIGVEVNKDNFPQRCLFSKKNIFRKIQTTLVY